MKWSASNKLNYSLLCEKLVGQYDKAYCKYLPENLEMAKKCLLDCFFYQIFCSSENR